MTTNNVIAVDGPTAAGKTTTSRRIAADLGISYLESGRTYRYVAHVVLREHIDVDDEVAVTVAAERIIDHRDYLDVLSAPDDQVTYLRSVRVTRAVSRVAALDRLRYGVTNIIRTWAQSVGPCIVEGRDIGTTVFPDARVKVFLTASSEIRARRRQVQEPGQRYETVLDDLLRRDEADRGRAASPLRAAADARWIDTSDMTVDDVVSEIAKLCDTRGFESAGPRGSSQSTEVPD